MRSASLTGPPASARDTVATDTPAAAATSLIRTVIAEIVSKESAMIANADMTTNGHVILEFPGIGHNHPLFTDITTHRTLTRNM
ncbi:protein of unknown function [Ralstonia solanacearum PSI07]|nr:protein of unknown function [Ralstonia solanacearum PSI07]